jgi:hypothetical protein
MRPCVGIPKHKGLAVGVDMFEKFNKGGLAGFGNVSTSSRIQASCLFCYLRIIPAKPVNHVIDCGPFAIVCVCQ